MSGRSSISKVILTVLRARAARDFLKDFGVFEHAKPKKSLARRGVWTLIRGWGHLLAPGGAPGGPDLLSRVLNGGSRLYIQYALRPAV